MADRNNDRKMRATSLIFGSPSCAHAASRLSKAIDFGGWPADFRV